MKLNGIVLIKVCLTMIIYFPTSLLAQTSDDTLDVAQGFETLNLAVSGDTPNPNRVYRLERGRSLFIKWFIVRFSRSDSQNSCSSWRWS